MFEIVRKWLPRFGGRKTPRPLNLALQGGGALGAFTWGVLDRLLEEEHIRFDTVSGASAGAMNAAVLASGLAADGRRGAREALRAFWERVARTTRLSGPGTASGQFMASLGFFLSPYQLNPLNFDPLRTILDDVVNFERLRTASPVRLIVAATNLRTEQARLFGAEELTVDVLLASSCLPMLHHAVHLDGDPYWDGGFSANPPLLPILKQARAHETLLVRLLEVGSAEPPASAPEITARLHRLAFNRPLADELDKLSLLRELAAELSTTPHGLLRKAGRHQLHEIDAGAWLDARLKAQWANPGPGVIEALFGHGSRAGEHWLRHGTPAPGQTSPQ